MNNIKKKTRFTLRRILFLLILIVFAFIARPVGFLVYNYYKDKKYTRVERIGYTNDASGLNETKIGTVVKVMDRADAAAAQISELIIQAKKEGKKISVAGAQHSMGGHTIYPDGILLDMKSFHAMQLDNQKNILTVGSGALWSEIIPFLDAHGKSIAVMQSNNSFSVGGSISVNCHGWQPNSPPIASTVQSFRLINADGVIMNCNREENPELFSLVLGGYGLFGVILDVQLWVTDNRMYTAQQHIIPSKDYIKAFDQYVTANPQVGMAYGRININPDNFMNEAILSTFITDTVSAIEPVKNGSFTAIRRTVFRASANSNYGKNLRWKTEKMAVSQFSGRKFSRNQLLNEGVEIFQNNDTAFTDILHEYFIPKGEVIHFINALKATIPSYKVDLLNITLRNVKKDTDTYLHYANEEVFGFVMLFNQAKDKHAEEEMQLLTRKLIDIAISLNGTYYLPYRLHATKEQMYKAYPQAKEFFFLKRRYDPTEVFANKFYGAYK